MMEAVVGLLIGKLGAAVANKAATYGASFCPRKLMASMAFLVRFLKLKGI
jgi:hypothetical protein